METARKSLLIIFYRNPEQGAVKTRLAATIGDEEALAIFNKLAAHTRDITQGLSMDKIVYYSEKIDRDDIWPGTSYRKARQQGVDLGDKMKNAFASGFSGGYGSVCIIGTDCYELTAGIITNAFESLRSADAVIGPAYDGGYYLLGMRRLHAGLFANKRWSTETVCRDTIDDLEKAGLKYVKLQTLRDVDVEDDLPEALRGE